MTADLVEVAGNAFLVRPETSDLKALQEPLEKKTYERKGFRIEPWERWLDLGANVGGFACRVNFGGGELVGAYEPHPEAAALCRRNLERHGFAPAVLECAVGEEAGTQLLHFGTEYGQWRSGLVKDRGHGGVEVDVVAFDDLLDLCRAEAIKMDIEGTEIELLQKPRDWKKVTKLVFEWHFDIDPRIATLKNAIAVLENSGFTCWHRGLGDQPTYEWFPQAVIVFAWRKP